MGILDGNQPTPIHAQAKGRIHAATPDGSQWELRVHITAIINGATEVVGEVIYRSFGGGIDVMEGLIRGANEEAGKVHKQFMEKVREQAFGVQGYGQMPRQLKN